MKLAPRNVSGWEPTPHWVVVEALKLADVRCCDRVFDLGCGDGRVVAIATRRFGACAVGCDIDPNLLISARRRVRRLGLASVVEIRSASMFRVADLESATVVYLYLPQSAVDLVTPTLCRRLRPGTRIVSVDSWLPNWPADKEIPVSWRGIDTYIGLWSV